MERLLDVLRALRAPDGCPWDRAQTHDSLRPQLLEEAAEAVDALGSGDDAAVVEELGDVLLHVGFHAVLGEESGRFDADAILDALVAKLVRRHPHVFAGERAADAADVEATWARVKAEERGGAPRDPLDAVPASLPALARGAGLADALGWAPDDDAVARAGAGADDDATLAGALLALAIRANRRGVDPEVLLRDALRERAAPHGGADDAAGAA